MTRSACAWLLAVSAAGAAHAAPQSKEACFSAYEGSQRLRQKKQLVAAKKALIACSSESCPAALRGDCVTWLAEVENVLPTLVLSAGELTDVRVTEGDRVVADGLDGTAIPFDPGEHTLRFEAGGRVPVTRTILVREGEKARGVDVPLAPVAAEKPEPRGIEPPVIVLGAVGALALASFGFFAVRSHSAKSDLESCKGHCPEDDVDAVRRDQLIADVSLGVGIAAIGIAAYLHFGKSDDSVSIGVGRVATGMGVSLSLER